MKLTKPSSSASVSLAASLAAFLLGSSTASAQLVWNSSGPSNNWSTAAGNENWTGGVVWAQNSDAVFDVTSGTPESINVTTANTFNNITFDVDGFGIGSGGAGSFLLANDLASTITVTNAGHIGICSETIADNAGGASSLTKAGLGTLILSPTANNTFTGGVNVTAGTLQIGATGTTANITGILPASTGTLSIASGTTVNFILGLTSADQTFSNVLSGSGRVLLSFSGATARNAILSGVSPAFTGTLELSAAAATGNKLNAASLAIAPTAPLIVGTNTTFFTSGAATIVANPMTISGTGNNENRGALRLDTGVTYSGPITLAGDTTVGNSGSSGSTISGVISGPFALSTAATGAAQPIVLTGLNTFTGKTTTLGTHFLSVPVIGNAGSPNPLGTNATVDFGAAAAGGTLVYTGTGETTDRVLNLAGTTGGATLTHSGTGLLKFTSNLTATGAGIKTLTLQGTGNTEIAGAIVSNSPTNTTGLTKAGAGTLTLSGANSFTGATNLNGGTTIAASASPFGVSTNTVNMGIGGAATLDLATDASISAYPFNGSSTNGCTIISNRATTGAGITHEFGAASIGNNTYTFAAGSNVTSGTAAVSFASLNVSAGSAGTLTLNPTTASLSIPGGASIVTSPAAKTLNLGGTNTGNSIAGNITNGTSPSVLSLIKSNTGTWTLSGTNTYTGTTAVNGGTLRLNYGASDTSKLPDGVALTLGGGTVELAGGTHTETVLSTTLAAGSVSTVSRSSGSAVLALGTVTPGAGAVVNFTGNNIATVTNANVNGILGSWATVTIGGSTEWAVNSGGFVTAFSDYDNISRLGGVIPDLASSNVLIINGGTSGNVTTAASLTTVSTIKLEASDGPGTIALPAGTLSVGGENNGGIWQTASSLGLTIGTAANEGFLTSGATVNATAATLNFINDSASNALTVNSAITNNGTDVVSLGKSGVGRLNLNGANSFTGSVAVNAGSVVLGSATALGVPATGSTLTLGTGTLLDLNGNSAAAYNHTGNAAAVVTDNASGSGTSILTLGNGTAAVSTTFLDGATRKLALRVTNANGGFLLTNAANTFSGGIVLTHSTAGTRMSPGTIAAGAYGTGSITVGESAADKAGIYFATANQTLPNPIIANTGLGTDRVGTFRVDLGGTILSGELTANLAPVTFGTNGTGAVTATNRITGPNGLTLLASSLGGTSLNVILANSGSPNDYAGDTVVNQGAVVGKTFTLTLGANEQIPSGSGKGNVSVTTNGTGVGTLNLAGFNETINGLSGNGVVTSSAGTPTLVIGDNNGDTSTFTGSFTGSLALTKTGTSNLTLSTANTYTGITTLSGGIVKAGIASALGTAAGGTVVNAGATFDFNGFALSAEAFTLAGGKLTNTGADQLSAANGAVTVTANSSAGGTGRWDVRTAASSLTVNTGVTLTKEDANVVAVVGRPMTNDGMVIVNGGAFAFHLTGTYGGAGTYTVNSGGSIQLGTYGSATPATLPNAITSNGGTLWSIDAAGTGGAPVFSGAITLAAATTTTLQADQGGIVSGVVSGAGSLNKTGANTFTLTAANTYSGNTTVSAGTLSVSGANFADASTVSVAAGAVLNLAFSGTDTVASLVLGGSVQVPGVYNSANSGGLITGAGSITVPSTGPTLAAFKAANFDTEEQGDILISGPTADPDLDGIPNVLEYAFASNPKGGTRANLPVANTVLDSGSTYVGCVYTRVKGATDLTFTAQFASTPDSGAFTASGATILGVVDNGNGTETVTLRDNTPVTSGSKRFVRILVTYP